MIRYENSGHLSEEKGERPTNSKGPPHSAEDTRCKHGLVCLQGLLNLSIAQAFGCETPAHAQAEPLRPGWPTVGKVLVS